MDFSLPALRTPADVLAVVPYLLGFVPDDSLVVMGLRVRRIVFQVRADLPGPGQAGEIAAHIGRVVARQQVTAALIVGYGPAAAVTPAVQSVRRELRREGIEVLEALRASGGRYWSYLCTRPACCPPAGTPYDVSTSTVAASATVAGLSPAASRDELVARLAPPRGDALAAARDAARRAEVRRRDLIGSADPGAAAEAGRRAVDTATVRVGDGAPLDDDEVAWLVLSLSDPAVRDHAWHAVGDDPQVRVDMWSDVVRRADPALVAAPATLLAFAAWRLGEGALASIALDRAATADPAYPLAGLLGEAIHEGVPPNRWRQLLAASTGADRTAARAPRGRRGGRGRGSRSRSGRMRRAGP